MNMSSPIIIKIYPKTWVIYKPLETEHDPQPKSDDSCYFSEDYVSHSAFVDPSHLPYMKKRSKHNICKAQCTAETQVPRI